MKSSLETGMHHDVFVVFFLFFFSIIIFFNTFLN